MRLNNDKKVWRLIFYDILKIKKLIYLSCFNLCKSSFELFIKSSIGGDNRFKIKYNNK